MNQENVSQENQVANVAAPMWFWVVGGILLLWNLMGLAAFAINMALSGNDEALQQSGLNEAQIELIKSTPNWVNVAFAVAVVFGVIGCISLLMRKNLAIPFLILSLLGVAAQFTYVFLLSNSVELMGVGLAPVVIPVAIALVPFAMYCANKSWWR